MKLTFDAGPGTTISRPVTSYKVAEKDAGQSYEVTIHDIYSEEERCILATVTILADSELEDPTSVVVATCKVGYFDVFSRKPREDVVTLSVVRNKRFDEPLPSDAKDDIELHRMRCEVATTLTEATTLADAGRILEARHMLVTVQGKVKSTLRQERPLAQHLIGTIGESIDGLRDKVTGGGGGVDGNHRRGLQDMLGGGGGGGGGGMHNLMLLCWCL